MGAIANDNPHALRQNIVDFDDGTYGVKLNNNFYRVDDDLPVAWWHPAYAQLGAENRMWVAITEKAYATAGYAGKAPNTYASLRGGRSVDGTRRSGDGDGERLFSSYGTQPPWPTISSPDGTITRR